MLETQYRYQQVAETIRNLIDGGALKPGDKVPSVRGLSKQLSVSISTVLEAYRRLEDSGLIYSRPQSGYYVRAKRLGLLEPPVSTPARKTISPDVTDLVLRIIRAAHDPAILPLGAAVPSAEFFPSNKLNRTLARTVRQPSAISNIYGPIAGNSALRKQIAKRMLHAGCSIKPEEIIVTSGAQEAVYLSLRSVTNPGDTVIVESPTYYALLQVLESLSLKVREISTDPRDGISIADVEKALKDGSVRALVLCPTFGNPLGHAMPEDRRKQLLKICEKAKVAIIEDDIYGELSHEGQRPRALKAFDKSGRVLLCSSFSKTLAPGYRVGWVIPSRYHETVEKLKFGISVATAGPTQLAVAEFLDSGGYEHHLRGLRRTYRDLVAKFRQAIGEHFPQGTLVSNPEGGHVLWVALPKEVDAMVVYEAALERQISIMPGPLFTATKGYENYIRINCAVTWSPRVELALETLGHLVETQFRTKEKQTTPSSMIPRNAANHLVVLSKQQAILIETDYGIGIFLPLAFKSYQPCFR